MLHSPCKHPKFGSIQGVRAFVRDTKSAVRTYAQGRKNQPIVLLLHDLTVLTNELKRLTAPNSQHIRAQGRYTSCQCGQRDGILVQSSTTASPLE